MDPSASVSSSSNISQLSKTRNRGSTELPPNQIQPLTPAEMRTKVVEILAGTANGCLQELGYYPGMPAKLQELEARAKTWQSENVKLFEDNVRLAANSKAHQESLRLLSEPDAEKIRRINDLEIENRSLKTQLEQMKMKVNADQAQLAAKNQNYAKLHQEFMALTQTYDVAYHEIVRLREITRGQSLNPRPQDQAAFQAYQQLAQRNVQNQGQIPPSGVPHVPSQAGHLMRLPPNQQMVTARPPVNIHVQQQQQLRRTEMDMNQNGDMQRQYYPSSSISSARVASGSIPNSMHPPQRQPPYPNLQNQQFPGQPPISPNIILPPQYQVPSTQYHPGPTQIHNMSATQNVRRASIANIPSNPHPPYNFGQQPPNNLQNPTMRVGSAPLPTQNPVVGLPPPLNAFNERMSFHNHPHSTQTTPTYEAPRPHIQSSGQYFPQPITISPNDTLINPPPTLLAPTPTVPTNVSAMIPQSASASPANTPTTRQSIQINESATTPVPIPPNAYRSNTHGSSASPILHPRPVHLKRDNAPMDADWPSEPNKKPRLHSPLAEQNTPPPPSPSLPPSTTESEPPNMEPTSAHTVEQAAEGTVEEEDDDEEEVVEVGPDGLRLVEDILEQVYGENRRGEVICWFCKHRYDNKYTDVPPTPFINATDQELEQHCMTEHLEAWNQARADV